MHNPNLNPAPAHASSPDADRAGEAAPGRLPEWLVHVLALIMLFLREHAYARRCARMPGWWVHRPDMVAGSTQELAASVRGAWGHEIAHMCRYSGIGPGHPEWPYLSRLILAFGGSLKGVDGRRHPRPWWQAPEIYSGRVHAEKAAMRVVAPLPVTAAAVAESTHPAATAVIVAGDPAAKAAIVAGDTAANAAIVAGPAWSIAPRRPVFTRAGTGPPTGPPPDRGLQFCHA